MKPGCPNIHCTFRGKKEFIRKDGFYFRKDDSRKIPRYKCGHCCKKFSSATFKLEYNHKKRRVNQKLFDLLNSGVSMRRSARILKIHRTTVHRKLIYLAKKSKLKQHVFLERLKSNPLIHIQFDDLISSIHTKLKPVSVSIAVDAKTRAILGVEVGTIPAFGHLADLARKKYGNRKNQHEEKMHKLFQQIKKAVCETALIEADEHHRYRKLVSEHFPKAEFRQYKGERGCVVGQGELKKVKSDPLFQINHTCAMLRANINRLIRRTWCTSKRLDMLQCHLDIYTQYHNSHL